MTILFVLNDAASKCIDLDDDDVEDKPGSSPAIQDRLVMKCNISYLLYFSANESQEQAFIDLGELISLASNGKKDLNHIQLLNTNLFICSLVLYVYTDCTSESLICFPSFFGSLY